MSSTMVYNVMGSIDERAISSLSFIANLTKFLSVDDKMKSEEDISAYFPELVWVIRDFALNLISKDKTPVSEEIKKKGIKLCLE